MNEKRNILPSLVPDICLSSPSLFLSLCLFFSFVYKLYSGSPQAPTSVPSVVLPLLSAPSQRRLKWALLRSKKKRLWLEINHVSIVP